MSQVCTFLILCAVLVRINIYVRSIFAHVGSVRMFNSSAAGDWVNCGICGEWAHFGCDRRQGLGAFKVSVLQLH